MNLNKTVTIVGAGDGTVIRFAGDAIGTPIFRVMAPNVCIRNVKLQNKQGTNSQQTSLVRAGTTDNASGLVLDNVTFDSAFQGVAVYAAKDTASNAETSRGITIINSRFTNLNGKAIYLEKGSDVTIRNNTFESCGAADYASSSGIDINLKHGDYSDYQISGNRFVGDPSFPGGAILLKARDDGDYSSPAATVTGIEITGNTFEGFGANKLVLGEPDKGNKGPADSEITHDLAAADITDNRA